jgi:hypothetical protein
VIKGGDMHQDKVDVNMEETNANTICEGERCEEEDLYPIEGVIPIS